MHIIHGINFPTHISAFYDQGCLKFEEISQLILRYIGNDLMNEAFELELKTSLSIFKRVSPLLYSLMNWLILQTFLHESNSDSN